MSSESDANAIARVTIIITAVIKLIMLIALFIITAIIAIVTIEKSVKLTLTTVTVIVVDFVTATFTDYFQDVMRYNQGFNLEYFKYDFTAMGIALAEVMKVKIMAARGFNSIIVSL